jgi:hypothetical protein
MSHIIILMSRISEPYTRGGKFVKKIFRIADSLSADPRTSHPCPFGVFKRDHLPWEKIVGKFDPRQVKQENPLGMERVSGGGGVSGVKRINEVMLIYKLTFMDLQRSRSRRSGTGSERIISFQQKT